MDRRQTLSMAPPAPATGSGPQLGPSRVSLKPTRPSDVFGGRMSISAVPRLSDASRPSLNSGKRASVLIPKSVNVGEKKDPRPLSDKKYQRGMIEALLSFLTAHNFDLSPKALQSPSGKEFRALMTFLFQLYDPNFAFGEKFEEDVRSYFRDVMGYPFAMSKQSLYAVGSPHTWPHILGAIVWFTEFLQYYETVGKDVGKNNFDNENEACFLEYLAVAYDHFMQNKDTSELDKNLLDQLRKNSEVLAEAISKARSRSDEIQQAIAQAKAKEAYLPELKATKANFLSDVGKFKQLNEQLAQTKQTLINKAQHRREEAENMERTVAELKAEKAALLQQIAQQGISSQEAQSLVQQRRVMSESLDALCAEKQRLQSEVFRVEMETSKSMGNLEGIIQSFNERWLRLCSDPVLANLALRKLDITLEQKEGGIPAPSVDPKELEALLLVVQKQLSIELVGAQAALRDVNDLKGLKSESLEESRMRMEAAKDRLTKAEGKYKQLRKEMEDDAARTTATIDQINSDIARLRMGSAVALEASQRDAQEAAQRVAEFEIEAEHELSILQGQLTEAMELVTQQQARIATIIDQTLAKAAAFGQTRSEGGNVRNGSGRSEVVLPSSGVPSASPMGVGKMTSSGNGKHQGQGGEMRPLQPHNPQRAARRGLLAPRAF